MLKLNFQDKLLTQNGSSGDGYLPSASVASAQILAHKLPDTQSSILWPDSLRLFSVRWPIFVCLLELIPH